MSEIRHDLIEDRYVIIAPERMHRPVYNMAWGKEEDANYVCPFCEGRESMTPPEIFAIRDKKSYPDEAGWTSRVVPNLFKAVQIETPDDYKQEGIYEAWDGFGAHEIIIDTPEHLLSMSEWKKSTFTTWLKTMQHRIKDLRNEQRIAFISLFKNHGPFAGATQGHPHTQLIGLPIIPKDEMDKYNRLYQHYHTTGRALLEDIIIQEEHDQHRLVAQKGMFTAFCPYASAYPFEVMIATKELTGPLDNIKEDDLNNISDLLVNVFQKLQAQLGNFDFNLAVSVPPMQERFDTENFFEHIDDMCRFNIRIMPRIYRHGGFELSTGTMINPVEPEQSAKLLRESDYEG